jgi:outer membrane protein
LLIKIVLEGDLSMKKLVSIIICMVVLVGTSFQAQAAEKIALISLQKALYDVNEGVKLRSTLKKEYEVKKKQIDGMKSELEKLSKDIEKQRMVLSEDALNTKRKGLQTKFLDLQNKAATFERELKTKEANSAKKILIKLRDIVLDYSKKEGYTLVIENSAETVLYSVNAEDITSKVISAYNKKK